MKIEKRRLAQFVVLAPLLVFVLLSGCGADLDQTIQKYDEVIKLDPANAGAYNNRGLAYYYAGDLEQAIRDFNQAIELAPQLAIVFYNRGKACHDYGDLEQAVLDYEQYLKLAPLTANRADVINTIEMIKAARMN